jgi:hypothetical protein
MTTELTPPAPRTDQTPEPLPLDQRIKTAKSEEVPELLEEIATLDDDVMRAIHMVTLAGKFKINKKALANKVDQIRAALSMGEAATTTMSASPPSVVDLGVDDEGNMTYIRARNDNPLV